MERDGTGQRSTIYTYGNQRINSESYNNISGLYTYDGRGSVSAVIGGYGDFRASYWYDGLGNVKSQIHGYGAFGSGKKYYGYNAEQYNPVTGNQNLRARQVNIRRQRFLTEDTYLGNKTDALSINRYIYGSDNPLKYKDPSGNVVISGTALLIGIAILGTGSIATAQIVTKYRNEISSAISNVAGATYDTIAGITSSVTNTIGTPPRRYVPDIPVLNSSEIISPSLTSNNLVTNSTSKKVKELIKQAQEMAATGTCSSASFDPNNNEDDDGFFKKGAKAIKNALKEMLDKKDYNSILEKIGEIIATGKLSEKKNAFIKYLDNEYRLVTHFDIGKAAHAIGEKFPSAINHINLEIHSNVGKLWDLHLILGEGFNITKFLITGRWSK